MERKRRWTFQISFLNIIVLIFSVLVNLAGGWLNNSCSLPFWLDSIGTIYAGSLLGPIAGGLVGILSSCVNAVADPTALAYAVTSMSVGIVVGMFHLENVTELFQIFCTAAIVAVVSILISTPINLMLHDGYMGNIWGDALFEMLVQSGNGRVLSSALGEALVDIPDKVISLLLSTGLIRIWRKVERKQSLRE